MLSCYTVGQSFSYSSRVAEDLLPRDSRVAGGKNASATGLACGGSCPRGMFAKKIIICRLSILPALVRCINRARFLWSRPLEAQR